VIGALVVVGLAAVVVAVVYVAKNKDAWRAKAKEIATEGREFGAGTDTQGCLDESMRRYKRDPGFFNAATTQGFMVGCLDTSRPTAGFCDQIPLGQMMPIRQWQGAHCQKYGVPNDGKCQIILTPIVIFCGEQRDKERTRQGG
jgi:hypothetical protein